MPSVGSPMRILYLIYSASTPGPFTTLNGIGSVCSLKSTTDALSGEPVLGPYIFPSGLHTPSTILQFIEQYFTRFIDNKRQFPSFWMANPMDAKKLRQSDAVFVNTFTFN